ncbi:GNAT family N-acetyltransferase [Solirubrobacter ginsenosidimutans]|uniref:GNAT family N-acetyltransferase n=1 Tax=Solirubrobacter ginsenosidimutans TaxID=490573 RepID=A0A9X3S6Q3_9ACTN|nr:GNAT family N-acetyltransferase [Solirubrobacter ginsenosidimutans]MDA0165346.1 GNAT family N-acetyltransferase [Solirubrobacter ginsenosidimutans]
MQPLEIRVATEAEFDAVGDLCVAAYAPFLSQAGNYADVLRDAAARAHAAELLVAVDAEQLLGTVTFVPDGGPLGEIATDDETEFRMLAVSPAAQGRGVGTELLRRVVEETASRGRAGVVCSSQPAMRAAHRIYERLGFTRDPQRDWSPLPGVDLLAFALLL